MNRLLLFQRCIYKDSPHDGDNRPSKARRTKGSSRCNVNRKETRCEKRSDGEARFGRCAG